MKLWKINFMKQIEHDRMTKPMFTFREVMAELGLNHVSNQDAYDIIQAAVKTDIPFGFISISGEPVVNGFFSTLSCGHSRLNRREINFLAYLLRTS